MKCEHKPDTPISEFILNYGLTSKKFSNVSLRCRKCGKKIILRKRHTFLLLCMFLLIFAISWCAAIAFYRMFISFTAFCISYAVSAVVLLSLFITKFLDSFYEFEEEKKEADFESESKSQEIGKCFKIVSITFLVFLIFIIALTLIH